MRKLGALNKLHPRPPLNEHIEQSFRENLHGAWLAVACLYDYLEVLHQDGVLYCPYAGIERALKDLAETRDRLDPNGDCDFELDLPPDCPEIIAAEKAYIARGRVAA
jgi:hypothetical protein